MREIKFRVWGDRLLQCSGLRDKDGHDIFEGDILEYTGADVRGIRYHQLYEVRFGIYDNNECYDDNVSGYGWWLFNFKFSRDSGGTDYPNEVYDYRGLHGMRNMTVIGNIYENPELLERKLP